MKTGARKCTWRHWELQLSAYHHATHLLRGEQPRALRLVQLLKTKERAIVVENLSLTPWDERWFVEVACGVYDSAARSAFHPSPSHRCGACEYRRACRGLPPRID